MSSTTRPARLSSSVAALIGVLSVAAALGAGHLLAGLVSPSASPFVAVGNRAIELSPPWLVTFAVDTFGEYDGIALVVGMAAVVAAVAAAGGLASTRSAVPGVVVIAVLGVVGGVAALTGRTATGVDVIPAVVALLCGVVAFVVLHRLGWHVAEARARSEPTGAPLAVSRRRLLAGTVGVAAVAGLAGLGGRLLSGAAAAQDSRRALGPITPDRPAPPIPAGADFAQVGTPTFITPNAEFYRVDINRVNIPQLRAEDWRLRIHGMVDREITLDFDDLVSRRSVERTVTMTCVSNEVGGPYVSTSNFTGVMLRDILAEVGVQDGADQVLSTSVDGWTCGTPTAQVMDPDNEAMLVYAMNREPLPVEHGFPVRMLVAGLYGFVSATKWITDMKLTTFERDVAYWRQPGRDWATRAPIKTQSRIDAPGPFERVPAGQVTIAGIAWAQTTGIERVEVRIDGGQWTAATLSTEVNLDTWRMWKLPLRGLAPGVHFAEVRATDKSGYTQTPERVMPIPDGATGWHSTRFTVQ